MNVLLLSLLTTIDPYLVLHAWQQQHSSLLGISHGVAIEAPDPEEAEVQAGLRRRLGAAINGHLRQDLPHGGAHLEAVAREAGPDHHVPAAAQEVHDEVGVGGHGADARLPDDRPSRGVHVVRHGLLDPPGHPVRDLRVAREPVAGVRVARRATVAADLDEPRELQRRRAVHGRVAVAGEGREPGARRDSLLLAGLHAPVEVERVQRPDREVHAPGTEQLGRPRAHRDDAPGAAERLAAGGPHHDAAAVGLGRPVDADDLGVVPDHGAFRDGERLEHGHGLGGAEHAAVVAERGDPPVHRARDGEGEGAAPPAVKVVLVHLLGADVGDGGSERGAAPRAHGEVRRRGEHAIAGLGLGGGPEAAGEAHHAEVPRLRVGVADDAGVAVRGAQRVEQVETLQQQDAGAARRRRVRRAAAHDAGAHHDDVEVGGWATGLGNCGRTGAGHGSSSRALCKLERTYGSWQEEKKIDFATWWSPVGWRWDRNWWPRP
jgi:hypothetical protein